MYALLRDDGDAEYLEAISDNIPALEAEGLKMYSAKAWEFKTETNRGVFLYRVGIYSYFIIRPVRFI